MELRLLAEAGAISAARHWIVDQAQAGGASDQAVQNLALVTSELVTNAVKYGPPGGSVIVEVDHDGRAIALTVSDESHDSPVLQPAAADRVGGHGVRIVQELTDDWTVDLHTGDGKSVSVTVPAG